MSDTTQPAANPTKKNPVENSPDFQSANLDEIGQDFIDSAPESEPEFVERLQEELAEEMGVSHSYQTGEPAPQEAEIIRDKNGHIFDPEICKIDESGNPIFTKTGLFELKGKFKRSRLRKQIRVPKEPKAPEQPPEPLPFVPDDCDTTAATIDDFYWSAMGAFGAQKIPEISQAGKEAMANGFRQMDNPPKLPWWAGVAAIYGSATAAILNREEAKPMKKKIGEKMTLWWVKIRSMRRRKLAGEGA